MDRETPVRRRTVLAGLGAAVPAVLLATPAQAATPVKFRPGHYAWIQTLYWTAARRDSTLAFVDSLASMPNVKGIILHLNWAYFESAQGDYRAGFAIVDEVLGRLPAGRCLMVQVAERSFGNQLTNVYPSYVSYHRDGWVALKPDDEDWSGNLQSVAKMWLEPVMTRLIALSQAYAARYDTNPKFASFGLGETALGAETGANIPNFYAQIKRWFTESKKVWTHTPLRLCANYTAGDPAMLDLFTHVTTTVVPGGVTIGGPDPELPLPTVTRPIQANRLFRGEPVQGVTPQPPNPPDLRGAVPWTGEIQELGNGVRYEEPPWDVWDYYYGRMHASYMVWLVIRNREDLDGPDQQWPVVLNYIDSIGGRVHTTLPTLGSWELG